MEPIDLLVKDLAEIVTFDTDTLLTGSDFSKKLRLLKGDIAIHEGKILQIGGDLSNLYDPTKLVDAEGMTGLPGFVDAHTHLVYAGSRHQELEEKISGKSSYEDQHRGGKGILYTMSETRKASVDHLVRSSLKDLDQMMAHGTTTVEIKTGYGLNRVDELKILEVIFKLKKLHPMTIVSTFLAAHAFPPEFTNDRNGYVQLVKSLLPETKEFSTYCDVFCDPLGFTADETREILKEANRLGLKPRIHIDQTANILGGEVALECGAVSVSHADYTSDAALARMALSKMCVELLPGVTYHLAESVTGGKTLKDFWPQRTRMIIDLGISVVIATNYNPGSSRMLSMQAAMQHGSRLNRMSFAEVIGAATVNPSISVGQGLIRGNILSGYNADIAIFDVPEFGEIIDRTGTNLVRYVIKDGKLMVNRTDFVGRKSHRSGY